MNYRLIVFLIILWNPHYLFAACPDWPAQVTTEGSQGANQVLIGKLYLNDEVITDENDLVGAFANGNEVRGAGPPTYESGVDDYRTYLLIWGPAEGAEIEFKMCDEPSGEIYDITETLAYESNEVAGEVENPFLLHAYANVPPISVSETVSTAEDSTLNFTLSATDLNGDSLTFTILQPPLHGQLSGTAPDLSYQPVTNFFGMDSLRFSACDPSGGCDSATVSITVESVNDPPAAQADTFSVMEDGILTISAAQGVLVNDTDVEADILTAVLDQTVAEGSLTLDSDGGFSYEPPPDFYGSAQFTYQANDGMDASSVVTVNLTVEAVNDPPQAIAQTATTAEDEPLTLTVAATDVDGDALTYTRVEGPFHGSIDGEMPTVPYTPAAHYFGTDSLLFAACDGSACDSAWVSLTITAVNDTPLVTDEALTIAEDSTVVLTEAELLSNDTDIEGEPLTISSVTNPVNGEVEYTTGAVTFTPTANFFGQASFDYLVSDGQAESSGTVTLTVEAVNDPPQAIAQTATTAEDEPLTLTVAATDVDGDALTYTRVEGPFQGSIDGEMPTVLYTPAAHYFGTDSLLFAACDGSACDSAWVSLTITAVNDTPLVTDEALTIAEDSTVVLTEAELLSNDTDIDGEPLTISSVTNPVNGEVEYTTGTVTFTPTANFFGQASFDYLVSDGQAESSGTVTLTVEAVNDPPQAIAQTITTQEETAASFMLTGTDVDGDALSFTVTTEPVNGTLSGTPPQLTYTPEAEFLGADSLFFTVQDGEFSSEPARVLIRVNERGNLPPSATAQSLDIAEDDSLSITLTGSDPDGDSITYEITEAPDHGTLLGSPPAITYHPDDNFHGTDTFAFVTHDGQTNSSAATVTITITPVNDPPQVADETETLDEDNTLTMSVADLLANDSDVDGDNLWIATVEQPLNGTVELEDGVVTFQPTANFFGEASFTYEVSDSVVTRTGMVSIDILPVNDPPQITLSPVTFIYGEGAAVADLTPLVSDVDDTSGFQFEISATDSVIATLNGTQLLLAASERVVHRVEGSVTVTVFDAAEANSSASVAVSILPRGDLTDDERLTMADLPLLIEGILRQRSLSTEERIHADVNQDGDSDVQDVLLLIDVIGQ